MKRPASAARRRLPHSPFNAPTLVPPLKEFQRGDRVSHDRYGLGRVLAVDEGVAVVVDFGSRKARITAPYEKLTKL